MINTDDIQKKIQSIERKVLYLTVIIISLTVWVVSLSFRSLKYYVTIQDTYFDIQDQLRSQTEIVSEYIENLEEAFPEIGKYSEKTE